MKFLFVLISLVQIIFLQKCNFTKLKEQTNVTKKYLYRDECQKVVSFFNKYVDKNINPCDNFYQFTCGKWLASKSKFKNLDTTGFLYDIQQDLNDYIIDFFKGKERIDSPVANKFRQIFQECIKERNNQCANFLQDLSNYAIYITFIEKITKNMDGMEEKSKLTEIIVDSIKKELIKVFNEKEWISDKMKKYFINKATSMLFENPIKDFNKSKEFMELCYKNLDIKNKYKNEDTIKYLIRFVEESDNILSFKEGSCKEKFFDPIYINLSANNAFYDASKNYHSISLPYIYKLSTCPKKTSFYNYGLANLMVGHEMIHGFDYENIMFAKDASVIEKNYKENLISKSKCFIKQYDNYKYENFSIDGGLTLNENIADNGGIKITHRAYLNYIKSNEKYENKPEGFENFTLEQLFFISVGINLCTYNSQKLVNDILADNHAPSEVRVNAMLSNYKPFLEAFKCGPETFMNPYEKCHLWRS